MQRDESFLFGRMKESENSTCGFKGMSSSFFSFFLFLFLFGLGFRVKESEESS